MGPWAFGVPLVLVSALGLVLNVYVVLVVFSLGKQTQQQQTANTLLLVHLGAVEAAVCLVLLIFATGNWPAAGTWCALHGFLLALLHPLALWTVTGLNCERYYAIAAPLHYSALVSPRRVALGLGLSWVGALLLCLTPFSGLVPPYRYVPGLGCCAPDFGSGGWGSAGALYGAVYAFLGLGLPALLVTACNLRVLGIARYHRHRIASAIYEVTLSAQVTITHQRNPFFVPAVTAPAAGGPPRFHSAASTVMQLVGSLYLLYFPYCGLILWEACGSGSSSSSLASSATTGATSIAGLASGMAGIVSSGIQQQPMMIQRPRLASSLASLLLACSPPINGLLYGLKSRALRRSVQNYWRKKATKSELQQEIQARTPSAAGSRRPSGSGPTGGSSGAPGATTTSSSFFPFPPLQRRLSEALLALGNCRAVGFGSGNIVGVFHRARLQPAASCNTLRVPNAELGETGRLVRSSASAASLMATHYRSDFGTTPDTTSPNQANNGTTIASPKRSPRILITRAYSEESQEGGSPLLRRHYGLPVSLPPCEKRRWRHRSVESDSSTGSSDASVWTTGVQATKPGRATAGALGRGNSSTETTGWPCPGGRRFTRVKTLEEGAPVFSTLAALSAGLIRPAGNVSESSDTNTDNTATTTSANSAKTNVSDQEPRQNISDESCREEPEDQDDRVEEEPVNSEFEEEESRRPEATARSDSSNSWSSGAEENSRGSDEGGLTMHPIGETIENGEEEEEEEGTCHPEPERTRSARRSRRKSRIVREAEAASDREQAASQLRPLLASTS